MRNPPRLLSVLAAAIALSGKADAAALGEVLAQSALGEPLRVELQLLGGGAPREAADCMRLAPHPDAPDGLPWLPKGEIQANGSRLVLTSAKPVFDPILRFALEDTCGARLRREYTLLLSYPEVPSTPVAEAEPPKAASPAPARPATKRAAAPTADKAQVWTTAPGESVESLAQALFPRDSDARRRFVAATLKANPGLHGGASATLPAGTELSIPDITRLPPAPRQQAQGGQPAATVPRARAATKPEPKPAPEQAERVERKSKSETPPAPSSDRLLLGGEAGGGNEPGLRLSTELESVHRTALTDESERALLRREQQLIMALDRITESQLALSDRIRRLEEIESALTQRAIEIGAIAPPPDAPTADKEPAPRESSPAPSAAEGEWLYAALLFAGAALALALVLLRVRQRRPQDAPPDGFEAYAPAAEATTGAPSPTKRPHDASPADETEIGQAPAPATASVSGGFAGVGYERAGYESASDVRRGAESAAPGSAVTWNEGDGFFSQPPAVASLIVEEEQTEEHDSAIELAEIMVSFGRVQGAAETLAEFIRGNPKQAVTPWLKLLEVYRMAGLRPEFDALARQLNKTFNVKTVSWENFDIARDTSESVEQMPHIVDMLKKTWGTRECQGYLQKLLRDNRDGTRQGFPLGVIDEILMLAGVLDQQLGPYRPDEAPAEAITANERKTA